MKYEDIPVETCCGEPMDFEVKECEICDPDFLDGHDVVEYYCPSCGRSFERSLVGRVE